MIVSHRSKYLLESISKRNNDQAEKAERGLLSHQGCNQEDDKSLSLWFEVYEDEMALSEIETLCGSAGGSRAKGKDGFRRDRAHDAQWPDLCGTMAAVGDTIA